jgi:septal ring factor EnvC (AmiA/AmiB activator)
VILSLILVFSLASCSVGLNQASNRKVEEIQRQINELNQNFKNVQAETKELNENLEALKAVLERLAKVMESLNDKVKGMLK